MGCRREQAGGNRTGCREGRIEPRSEDNVIRVGAGIQKVVCRSAVGLSFSHFFPGKQL